MKDNNAESLSETIDEIENIEAGMKLSMPAQFHLEQLKKYLPAWLKKLKSVYIEETGDNPWL